MGTNVRLYNANGSAVSGIAADPFQSTASHSAPLVFADGGVLAVDQFNIGYAPPSHTAWWTTPIYSSLPTLANPTPFGFDESSISPAFVNSYAFLATNCSTMDMYCGAAVFSMPTNYTFSGSTNQTGFFTETGVDSMKFNGDQYATVNSPGVDNVNNRVYVVTDKVLPGTALTEPGMLMRYTINSDGSLTQDDIQQFPGPSGASPVVIPNFTWVNPSNITYHGTAIFFDGVTRTHTAPSDTDCTATNSSSFNNSYSTACFLGVLDTAGYSNPGNPGTIVMWAHPYAGGLDSNNDPISTTFQAGAALDPRGGVWVFPVVSSSGLCKNLDTVLTDPMNNCLLLLSLKDGHIMQGPVEVTTALGGAPSPTVNPTSYLFPSSTANLSTKTISGTAHYYLTFGTVARGTGSITGTAATIDVTTASYTSQTSTSNDQPTRVWQTPAFNTTYGLTLGQFPFMTYTCGGVSCTSVFFNGQYFGTEIVTSPN